jgi:nucleotide-binding universal stress UspA family protein
MTAQTRILLASDGSTSAIRAAHTLCSLGAAADADIRIITVLSSGTQPRTGWGEELADSQERGERVLGLVDSATHEAKAQLEDTARRIEVSHRFGNPAEEILQEVEEWEPHLLVIGRRGLRGPERWLLGSVSEHIARRCKVPVLIVP